MKHETPPKKKEPKRESTKAVSETPGKEGNEELDSLRGLLTLGTMGFFGGLLWMAYQKTISPKKKPEPEAAPQVQEEESVEELARRLRDLLTLPPPEGEEEIRRMKQKQILEKLQSRMKPEDWPRVQEILRKPKPPQGR